MGKAARQRHREERPSKELADHVVRLKAHERSLEESFGPRIWDKFEGAAAKIRDVVEPLRPYPEFLWQPSMVGMMISRALMAAETPRIESFGAGNALWLMAAWRQGRGVYRFDSELAAALEPTKGTDTVPVEALYRLPEWSCYLLFPEPFEMREEDLGLVVGGCFVTLDVGEGEKWLPRLALLLDAYDPAEPTKARFLLPRWVELGPGLTVAEGLRKHLTKNLEAEDLAPDQVEELETANIDLVSRIVPYVLYLCAANADMTEVKGGPVRRPARDAPAARVTRQVDVGFRVGSALRRHRRVSERSEHQGGTVAPHLRRAHFHYYWVGPRSDPDLKLNWIAPTPVKGEPLEVVVRAVDHPTKETPANGRTTVLDAPVL